MQILSEVVTYEGMNIKKGNIWGVGGLQVPVCALKVWLGLLVRGFEGRFCFSLIGELPYRDAPLWGNSPIGMLPYGELPYRDAPLQGSSPTGMLLCRGVPSRIDLVFFAASPLVQSLDLKCSMKIPKFDHFLKHDNNMQMRFLSKICKFYQKW